MRHQNWKRTRGQPPRSLTRRIEPLEERLLLFATDIGGPWGADDLTWSIANLYDGNIRDDAGSALSNSEILDSVVEGLSVWTAVSPLKLRQVPDSGPAPADDHYAAGTHPDIRIGHHYIDGDDGEFVAHAFPPATSSGFPLYRRGLAGDIHLDNSDRFNNPDTGSELNLGQLIAHESGHAFGLWHEATDPAIMQFGLNGDPQMGFHWTNNGTGFILPDDIDGIQFLYGSGLGYVLTTDGWLHVSGTTGDNTIQVSHVSYEPSLDFIHVSSAGFGSFIIDTEDVTGIEVHARQGNDTVQISSLPDGVETFVYAGDGDDTINAGGSDFDTNIRANVLVYGGSGNDTVYFRDGDDGGSDDVTRVYADFVTKNTVANDATLGWDVSELEELIVVSSDMDGMVELDCSSDDSLGIEIWGNGGEDVFNLLGIDDGFSVTIDGGDADDTFNVGYDTRADYDFYINGSLAVDGGSGFDAVTIRDANDHSSHDYRLDSNHFEKPGSVRALLTYQGMEEIDIRANGYANSIDVEAIGSTVQNLKVHAGGGNDTLTAGHGDLGDNLFNAVLFTGDEGTDQLVFDDQLDLGMDAYTLAPDHLVAGDAQLIKFNRAYSYRDFESVELLANGYANTITVRGTDSGVPVVLKGNGGPDEFVITEGDLDRLQATVDVQGGSNADTLVIDDTSSVLTGPGFADDSYVVTTTEVVKTQVGFDPTITYSSISSLELQANGDDSSIDIPAAFRFTDVAVFGNSGSDRFYVARSEKNLDDIDSPLTLDGGSFNDTTDKLTVYDTNADPTVVRTYDIDGDTINRTSASPISFVNFEKTTLNGSGADDMVNVGNPLGTSISTEFLIDAGGGNDTVNVGGGNVLSSIDNSDLVSVVGGDGQDTVQLDDQDATTAGAYTVTSTILQKSVSASYSEFEDIDLFTGTMNVGGSYIAVDSTAPGAALDIVYQGNGSTRVTLGSGDLLSDLGGDVSLTRTGIGMPPDLILDDTNGSINSYLIDASANPMNIDCDAGSLLVTADFDDLTLHANDNPNTIEISDARWLDDVTLNGNGGDDDFYVNTDVPSGSPYINIDGGAPTTPPGDDLFVSGTTGTYQPDSATTGAGTVTGTGGLTLEFVNFEPLYATDYTSFALITPNSDDVISLEHDRISGTSNGIVFEPLIFTDVTNVVLDTDTHNGAINRDELTIVDSDGQISDYTIDASELLLTTDLGSTLAITIDPVDALIINASDDPNSINVMNHSVLSDIELNGNGGEDMFLVAAANATTVDIEIDGGNPTSKPGDALEVYGTGSETITDTKHPTDSSAGWITNPDGLYIHYVGLEPIIARQFASVTMVTANSDDTIIIDSPDAGRNRISGTSGGVAFEELVFFDVAEVILDTASQGGTDSVTIADPGLVGRGLTSFTHVSPSGTSIFHRSDFDLDEDSDLHDIDTLTQVIAVGQYSATFDINVDSAVDLLDLTEWLRLAGAVNLPSGNAYLLGDATLDGVVDGQDFIEWNTHKFTSLAKWSAGDFNADGVVDGQDFISWNNNKFQSSDGLASGPSPSLPIIQSEPTSFGFVGVDKATAGPVGAEPRTAAKVQLPALAAKQVDEVFATLLATAQIDDSPSSCREFPTASVGGSLVLALESVDHDWEISWSLALALAGDGR